MRNRLLRSLDPAHVDLLRPHIDDVELPARLTVYRQDSPIDNIYFLEAGMASLISVSDGESIEIGLVGSEGMIGGSALLSVDDIHPEVLMQVAGRALRISVPDFKQQAEACPELAMMAQRFLQASIDQICSTSLANGRGTVEKRLARWLLMAHDRRDGDEIPLTHEFLAVILGVRRPGITVALHVMEGRSAIRSRRNSIVIVDRSLLRGMAGSMYGHTESQYERLFGVRLSKDPAGASLPGNGS